MGLYESQVTLIDFLSSFQDGIVASDIDPYNSMHDLTSQIKTAKRSGIQETTEQFITIRWELPDQLIEQFSKSGDDLINVPPLPVEFIKEIKLQSDALYKEFLNQLFALNIRLEELFFRVTVDNQVENANKTTVCSIRPTYEVQFPRFSSIIRMARSIVFGIQTYRKQNELTKTNFDLSVHRAWGFLSGNRIDMPKAEINLSMRKFEKAFQSASKKFGYKIPFSKTRKPITIGPENIIEAIAEVLHAEKRGELLQLPGLKKGEMPDCVFFKMILKRIWRMPFTPNNAWQELTNTLDNFKVYDGEKNGLFIKYRLIASELIQSATIDKIKYADLISKNGDAFPGLCALIIYFGSDDLSDRERLKQRIKAFKAGSAIAWATRVLFGSQNGYAKPLSFLILSDNQFRTMFKTAANRLMTPEKEVLQNVTDTTIETPSIHHKNEGIVRFELHLPDGYPYFVDIYDPIERLYNMFLDMVSHSISDERLRYLIFESAIDLSLPVLDGFKKAVNPIVSQKNIEFKVNKGTVKFSGMWNLSWETDADRWKHFFEYLSVKKSILEKHIKRHRSSWELIIQKLIRGS